MKKIVLIFGLISGLVIVPPVILMAVQCARGNYNFDKGAVVGYSLMVLAYLTVFFGIRTYRENVGRGLISFGKAFRVGILITLITCACYVGSWEIVYYNFFPNFEDAYAKHVIVQLQREGASDATIAKKTQEMNDFKRMYKNPLFNVGMTFLEIFPVGLIVTLVSAAILRRRPPAATVPA